jgi:hypothetical protein
MADRPGAGSHTSLAFTYDRHGDLFSEVDSTAAVKLDAVRTLSLGAGMARTAQAVESARYSNFLRARGHY